MYAPNVTTYGNQCDSLLLTVRVTICPPIGGGEPPAPLGGGTVSLLFAAIGEAITLG